MIPRIGPTPIQKLQPATVQSMLAELLESGRKVAPNAEPRGLSAATVHTTRAILRAVLAHAEKLGVVGRNVARLVSPPRVVRYRPTVLVRDQFERFIEAAFGSRLGVAMLVSLAVGTRIGEALALGWEDVDLETGSLRVSYALQRVKDEATGKARLVLEEPKSERSRRTLPPPPTVIGWLKRHRARQAEERLLAGGDWRSDKRFVKGGDWQGREFVFTTQTGTPLNDWNLRDALRALEAAKLPHMRFHDLRHSCASFLLSQGAHARLIMEQLGHSQIGITMNLYAHVMPAARKEAADLTDAALDVKMARG